MNTRVSLNSTKGSSFEPWDPSTFGSISSEFLAGENNFSCLNVSALVTDFRSDMIKFFTSFGAHETQIKVRCRNGISDVAERGFGFIVDGADGMVLLSGAGVDKISGIFGNSNLPSNAESASRISFSEVALEYFIMKTIQSLCASGNNELKYKLVFTGETAHADFQEYKGEVLSLSFTFGTDCFTVDVVLPQPLVSFYKNGGVVILPYLNTSLETFAKTDQLLRYTVPLFNFWVHPGELLEYLQVGSVIVLEQESISNVRHVFLNLEQKAIGKIMCSEEYFLVDYTSGEDLALEDQTSIEQDGTRVQVVLIDEVVHISELSSAPKYYKTKTPVSSVVQLVISGEVVAKGTLGFIDQKVGIHIISA